MAKKREHEEAGDGGQAVQEAGEALQSAAENMDRLANEIGSAGIFDDPNVTNPLEMLRRKKEKIESEHEGTRGAWNWLLGEMGIEPSYDDEIGQLDEAERQYLDQDRKDNEIQQRSEAKKKLQDLLKRTQATAKASGESSLQQEFDEIEGDYKQQIAEAEQLSKLPYYDVGLGSEAELQADVQKLKDDAETIRSSRARRLGETALNQIYDDQGRLKELQLEGAGDIVGARRQALLDDLYRQREQIDPQDQEALKRFQGIQDQTLKNFDADAARQKKLQQDQSDDEVAKYKEEQNEAELRLQGKDNEAQIAHLKFSIEQETKRLREQADAEVDPDRKKQLEQQADASAARETPELDSLRKQLQRESQTGDPSTSPLHDGKDITLAFAEAVKKLDDAATKLDKALSKAKGVQLLAD